MELMRMAPEAVVPAQTKVRSVPQQGRKQRTSHSTMPNVQLDPDCFLRSIPLDLRERAVRVKLCRPGQGAACE